VPLGLKDRLVALIARQGPISVADYMTACLHDPADGYYAARPALGEAGDFITAAHVSQMFGELIGLWAAEAWTRLGRPARVRLVELGPGDGTMIIDVLRAAKAAAGFLEACEVWLIETSGPLQALQAAALAKEAAPARWAASLDDVPRDAPLIILANEFLDCMAVRQAVRVDGRWLERRVGVDEGGALAFVPGHACQSVAEVFEEGAVLEWSEDLADFGRRTGDLVSRATGAALFVDYGRDAPGHGDTLQALRGHRKEGPLDNPGLADLTAHVDFPAFLEAARAAGAAAAPIRRQGDFLRALGIEARAEALALARPDRCDLIARQLARLTGADQMGDLFKVACIHSQGLAPPGFEAP
jgi:SAM-dependent MidA family methyltransferase